MDFQVKYKNERDVEIPLLIDFIGKHKDIKKALDVGCYGALYLEKVKKIVKVLDGIDFISGNAVSHHLNTYYHGDVLERDLSLYDLVISISVIEHYGIKQKPTANYQDKQIELVKRIGELSKKYIFLTFPYGLPQQHENEFTQIDKEQLKRFEQILKDFKLIKTFYFNNNPPLGNPYVKIAQVVANNMEYVRTLGVRCICVLEGCKYG